MCPQVCIRSQVPQASHSICCIAGDAGTVLYQSPVTQVRHIASDYRLVKNLHPRAETVRKSAPPRQAAPIASTIQVWRSPLRRGKTQIGRLESS